jgi:hypothetical protein
MVLTCSQCHGIEHAELHQLLLMHRDNFTFSFSFVILDSKGFWWLCIALRITGFLVFFHRPVLQKLENTTFQKLNLFPSSGEGRKTPTQLGPLQSLRKSWGPQSLDHSCLSLMLWPVGQLFCLGIKHSSGAYNQIFITVRQPLSDSHSSLITWGPANLVGDNTKMCSKNCDRACTCVEQG